MPQLLHVCKSLEDVEPHKYENWGSISGSSMSGSIENSLSRSQRCFQAPNPGENNSNQNYYSTTRNITPGPGSYDSNNRSSSPIYSFGISKKERTLSQSNRMWAPSDLSVPPPGSYNIDGQRNMEHIKDLLGVTKWKLKNAKRKLKTLHNLSKFEKKQLEKDVKLCEKRISSINNELSTVPPPVSPIKTNKHPFVLTELKPHQKTVRMQDTPGFYMNEAKDWDFGSYNRDLNIHDMSSFGYSKRFVEQKEAEETKNVRIASGALKSPSHCRATDFFGPNKAHRNETPAVGSYSPEAVPTNYQYGSTGTIKSGFDDCSLSTHTSWNTNKTGTYSFNFSRSSSLKKPISPSSKGVLSLTKPRIVYAGKRINAQNVASTTSTRRNSNCSDITCGTLPTPGKRIESGDSQVEFPLLSPVQK